MFIIFVFNGLLCTKGITFKIHLIVHIIMRRVLIFKLVQHEWNLYWSNECYDFSCILGLCIVFAQGNGFLFYLLFMIAKIGVCTWLWMCSGYHSATVFRFYCSGVRVCLRVCFFLIHTYVCQRNLYAAFLCFGSVGSWD